MGILDRWIVLADRASVVAVRAAGALILASALLVGFEVLIRKLFGVTIGGADELSGYAFAIGTTWALAFTLLRRANVRVDALYMRLPRRVCAMLDLVAVLALTFFVSYLAWRGFTVLEESLRVGARAATPLGTPQWLPQLLWLAGFALFLFAAVPLTLRVAAGLLRGDVATVARLAGARSIEEEAAGEASHTHGAVPAAGGAAR